MIRFPMIRVLLAVGALAISQVPNAVHAADPSPGQQTTAEKEGFRLVEVGQKEQLAAKSDKARAEAFEHQAETLKKTAEHNKDKGAEGRAELMKRQAEALDKAADLRADAAKEMIDDGHELTKTGAKQREAAAKAVVVPAM
jgi:hypothetical protein